MLSLHKMIKKSLLLRDSPSATLFLNYDIVLKLHPTTDFLPRASTERWNQANMIYFDLHLNRIHGKGEIVLLGKDVYYRNVILFVQRLQSLVTF